MKERAGTQILGVVGVVMLFLLMGNWREHDRLVARLALAGTVSLVMWLMICGLTGLFLRYLNRFVPCVRYLADSSCWLHIVHMLALMAFQILLRPVPWPAAAKVWIVLALAIPVMLASCHFWVRPTIIGRILNARRYRGAPGPGTSGHL